MCRSSVLILFSLVLASTAMSEPAQHAAITGAQHVVLGGDVVTALTRLSGEGISLGPSVASRTLVEADGARIVWKQYRSASVPPMQHTFYRQYCIDPRTGEAVPLLGGYMTVHFRNGLLSNVLGTQFSNVRITTRRAISASEAVVRARARLAEIAGLHIEAAMALTPAVIAERARDAHVFLASKQDGTSFRYMYSVILRDVWDAPFDATIDAQTGELVDYHPVDPSGCTHSPGTSISAVGLSQNPNVPGQGVRSLRANSPGAQPDFPYDGIWANCMPYSSCTVMQQTETTAYECNTSLSPSYTLFPVADSVGAVYQSTGEWNGFAAADALYFTQQTWSAITAINYYYTSEPYFPEDKNIVVESSYNGTNDNAYYVSSGGRYAPAKSVVVNFHSTYPYTFAAALDVVAHEWGHYIEEKLAGWPYSGVGAELQEGYADVVGQAVEKTAQPAGTGPETSSDWDVGEDATGGIYLRSGLNNDGDSGHSIGGVNVNNRWHRLDATTGDAHDNGNVASVMFQLLANGGTNDVCGLHPGFDGCNITVTGLGVTKATRILMENLMFYSWPSEDWNDVATGAAVAANNVYAGSDPPCGLFEQQQVINAFAAIGYPVRIDGQGGPPWC